MKESEKNLEDILKKGLQDRFDSFEPEVRPSLSAKIFRNIPSRKPRAVWYATAILLLLTGILWTINSVEYQSKGSELKIITKNTELKYSTPHVPLKNEIAKIPFEEKDHLILKKPTNPAITPAKELLP